MKIPFHHSDMNARVPLRVHKLHCKVEVLTTTTELVDGRPLRKSVYVVDDSETRFKGMKASDFALENLLAAGVNLRSSFVTPSQFSAVDNALPNVIKLAEFAEQSKAS